MKPTLRNTLYGALVLFCLLAAGFIFLNGKSQTPVYELKERTGALAAAPEWAATQARVSQLMAGLKAKPGDAKLTLQLAKEFMQEGRATGDFSYYNKAALDLIEGVLVKDNKNFEAICLKAMVYLSQHRFAEGKEIALAGLQLNPYNSFIYGLLVDANVELGNYPEAVQMCDKMVGIRPDIRSYSRVSYLREIHGDLPGAIEAIRLAVAAGYPGYEDTEWARMVLAHLYEDSGAPEQAEKQYQTALQERPDYPFALAGLARIARFKKDYPTAIRHLERAKDIMSDASFFEELAEVYRLNGQADKAAECNRVTLNALLADNLTAGKDKNAGHYSDMELATLYLKTNELDKALEHARTEQQRRPDNIDACETLAWVLYRQGKAAEALPLIRTALRTQSQKPERLLRAGLIYLAAGQAAEGRALLQKGLELKPYLDEALAAEAYSNIKG